MAMPFEVTSQGLAVLLFWLSIAAIVFAYFGFPVLVALRGLLAPVAPPRTAKPAYRLTIVIAAHNEEAVLAAKLANLRSLDYPAERIEIIAASDGSNDATVPILRAEASKDPRIRVLDLPRGGKNRALNRALEISRGEIVVFTDCDTLLDADCLEHLLAPFADPSVGGTGGDFRYAKPGADSGARGGEGRGERGVGQGERLYWGYDRLWKRLQSRAGSMTSATGQIYALRRNLLSQVPDGVTDDFFQSTGVIAAGYRLHFCPKAVGRGPTAEAADAEFRRKVRVSARGLASVWERRALLNPLRFGFYAFQLWSHKVMRRLVGVPLVMLFGTSLWLVCLAPGSTAFALPLLVAQLGFHAAALLGWWARNRELPGGSLIGLFRIPLYFDLVNAAALIAAGEVLAGKRYAVWSPERGA